jgi:hypothetical protein
MPQYSFMPPAVNLYILLLQNDDEAVPSLNASQHPAGDHPATSSSPAGKLTGGQAHWRARTRTGAVAASLGKREERSGATIIHLHDVTYDGGRGAEVLASTEPATAAPGAGRAPGPECAAQARVPPRPGDA